MYWMINLSSSAEQFFIFYFIVFLVSFAGNSLGLFLGSVINDAKSVSSAIPMVILPFILFSGFFKNRADLPAWIGWI
jgi:ABC-type multidrug transport system permease subunit